VYLESPYTVSLRYFEVSSGFLTNRPNIAKKAIFVGGFILRHYINRYNGHVKPHNCLHPIRPKLDEITFQTSQERKLAINGAATARLVHLRDIQTHKHTYTMTLTDHLS